ncbi:Dual specificity protein kinase shkA [Phytophthora ramorum]|uniref:Dual specificity protein kinase shkA n=1 Tax=Phytophthora ramorum TaxID=164328 RepID=UPI0030948D33|nr:Dual specificity protein kinase shkA [Phytophthora ramorum]
MSSTTTASASHQVCDGLPALVTRSSTETPNGGCPGELTALNASCTCLTGYSETAISWTFHITAESWNSTTSTTTRSLTQSSSDELAINTIRPIWVSSSLETLVIEGAGEAPAEIEFTDENRVASGSSLALVRSVSNSTNISTLSLYNLDLNSVAETNSDFVPATVTNLTLRNCNISTLSTTFTRDWSWLQYLDLSSNNIDTAYIGGVDLKELNLSHNALAVFPAESLNSSGLQALYIQGNDITDFNVSQEQFEKIQGLTAFTADQPESSSTCQDGAWQSVHGITFCVLGASTAAVPDSSQSSASSSDNDNGGLGLLGYWLIAGAIIVFFLLLLVIWQRRRHSRERESSPMVSPEAVEPTTPKYNGDDAFEVLLGHDYDERADIYSFGVVLSEIDTDDYPYWNAQHPPQGKVQENEILRLVARGAKRPAFSDDCPPAILELAARCLRADPKERPSASEIVEYLQELVQDRNSSASFSAITRPGNSFDFNTHSTNSSSPTRTAPANAIMNLRPSGQQIQQKQAMAEPASAAAAYAAGKRTTTTTTTTTTKVASSSIGAGVSISRPTAAEALAPAHEVVVSSPQVTHQVVRTKLPLKGKRTTTTTTTTARRAEQGSTGGITSGHVPTGMVVRSSNGDNRGRGFGSESVQSNQSHARATSPASFRANYQDNLSQQRQPSSSSGEEEKKHEIGIDHQRQTWVVYDDIKEL